MIVLTLKAVTVQAFANPCYRFSLNQYHLDVLDFTLRCRMRCHKVVVWRANSKYRVSGFETYMARNKYYRHGRQREATSSKKKFRFLRKYSTKLSIPGCAFRRIKFRGMTCILACALVAFSAFEFLTAFNKFRHFMEVRFQVDSSRWKHTLSSTTTFHLWNGVQVNKMCTNSFVPEKRYTWSPIDSTSRNQNAMQKFHPPILSTAGQINLRLVRLPVAIHVSLAKGPGFQIL